MLKISVVLLIKNGYDYIIYLDNLFNEIELKYKNIYDFDFYFYENNSLDKTVDAFKIFFKNRKGEFFSENLSFNKNFSDLIAKERAQYMAFLRNKLKSKHKSLDSDFTLLLDADIVFNIETLERLLLNFNQIDNLIAINPFDLYYPKYEKYKIFHYYDSLAFITKDNITHVETKNCCMFSECRSCCIITKKKKLNLLNRNNITEVNSAFGGFFIIKTSIYNLINWDEYTEDECEHHSFCKKISEFGSIFIDPRLIVATTITNNFRNVQKIIEKLNHK